MSCDKGVGLDEGKHLVQRTNGYAIAELAMAIPALLVIVAMSISLIGLTVTQIQLESAAALGARIVGRGDPIPDSFRNSLPEGTEIIVKPELEIVEFTLKSTRNVGLKFFPFQVLLTANARARLEPVFEEFG
ncbi:MAG: pilus assembly protein [Candidatus Nanopelagicales bacterium]|nr:pilus assembly protein [Candidatus Nanopelagicales bacterium]